MNLYLKRKSIRILRLSALCLTLGLGALFASETYSQKTLFTLSVENQSVKDVFDYIEQNSEFIIFYLDRTVDLNRKVSVDLKDQQVESILKQLFENTDNTYTINDRQIIISKKENERSRFTPDVSQSRAPIKRTLLGTVTDASTGETLIGVNIVIKGTTQGTITDLDGRFSIEVTDNTELVVSYIGYKEQTVAVGDLGIISIKMESSEEVLDEVVVVGAGTQKKVSITGAITSVEGAIMKTSSSSLTSNLSGKLAGVITQNTVGGEPGAASTFYIRGINTFGGVATPLILLDGVEISTGDLNRIPAETIESFSILKDASATAIYGNRGANGVMLITTKSGRENTKATVNVSVETSYFRPMNVVEFVDGVDYMNYYNEAQLARDANATLRYSDEKISNTAAGVDSYLYPNVDWFDLLFKNGNFNQRANVNVQGGSSRLTYYMSLQANHDTGLLDAPSDFVYNTNINSWWYNFQNNITYKITNSTTADLRLMTQIGNRQGPGYTVSSLYQSVMQANPVSFPAYYPSQEGDKAIHIRFGNELISGSTLGTNPYTQMLSSFAEYNYNTTTAALTLNQDLDFITKGLSAKVLVNLKNYAYTYYTRSFNPYYYTATAYNADTGEYELTSLNSDGTEYASESSISRYTDQTFYMDAQVNWKRSFYRHNLSAMLMYMMREYRSSTIPNRNQGYSGRFTYDYDNRYLLEFNFGYNGSERLAAGRRFEFFPAASAGWVVSGEKFWEPIAPYVNHLKIRTSYGLVGSDEFDSDAQHFLYLNTVNVGNSSDFYTGTPDNYIHRYGSTISILGNDEAGWEHVKKFDVGVDFSLFHQLNVTFDYFYDYRDRILMARGNFPDMLGYWGTTPWSNVGEVSNQGVELSVNWMKQFGKDWTVDFRGNFTYNQNEYKYADEPSYPYVWQTLTGKPLSRLTGYICDGFFTSEEEIANWADQSSLGTANLMPGDLKYRDINGDGVINSEDQVMLSPYGSVPRIQYGLGLNVRWKKFDFGVFFNGSAKRDIMINSGYAPFLSAGGDGNSSATLPRNMMQWIADGYWSEANPDPNAVYPRLGTSNTEVANNLVASSFWVRNGNFIRFKTLEIGYSFPFGRVYLNGDNLAVFSPFKYWDPELEWYTYPLQRTFTLGVQFTF